MSQKIVQINYKLSGSRDEYQAGNLPYAKPIAETPGLRWKVWIINEEEREAGGIYLFDDRDSAENFITGPIVIELKKDPSVNIKVFDVIEDLSAITRGPLR